MKKIDLLEKINGVKAISAWKKGVKLYAYELIENVDKDNLDFIGLENTLLNGAKDWAEFSYSGNSLIYDIDIATRLCTTSEFKNKRGGELKPNKREEWLDTQARALDHAYRMIKSIVRTNK